MTFLYRLASTAYSIVLGQWALPQAAHFVLPVTAHFLDVAAGTSGYSKLMCGILRPICRLCTHRIAWIGSQTAGGGRAGWCDFVAIFLSTAALSCSLLANPTLAGTARPARRPALQEFKRGTPPEQDNLPCNLGTC